MKANIKNCNIQQFFTDITYHCIQPTVRRYKLIEVSGFNLKEKMIHIFAYGLLPDEKFVTTSKFFSILQNLYKFRPKLVNTDFSKSLTKAIKTNFSECIMIECFFHWIQALLSKLKH